MLGLRVVDSVCSCERVVALQMRFSIFRAELDHVVGGEVVPLCGQAPVGVETIALGHYCERLKVSRTSTLSVARQDH